MDTLKALTSAKEQEMSNKKAPLFQALYPSVQNQIKVSTLTFWTSKKQCHHAKKSYCVLLMQFEPLEPLYT
jgi:hypothetical protein